MSVRIKAKLVTGRDLKPGDLFSTAGPEYWSTAADKLSVGEMVYIRTNSPGDLYKDVDEPIYLITVEHD